MTRLSKILLKILFLSVFTNTVIKDNAYAINRQLDIKDLIEKPDNENSYRIKNSHDKERFGLDNLGLDNVEKVNPKQVNLKSDATTIRPATNQRTILLQTTTLAKDSNSQKNISKESFKKKPIKTSAKLSKKPSKKVLNKKKIPQKSALRLKLEKQQKLEEIKTSQQEKELEHSKKFEELRKLYLADLLSKKDKTDEDIDYKDNIIPRKKDLAPFALEELPPLPILNRSRTLDNYHIPYVYTPKEHIDIMFYAISIGSISYFNEAYKYVLNPNVINNQGDTILTYAVLLKKYAVMISALSKGADPNLPNVLGYNPVHIALELKDFVALDILIKNNADLKYKDAFGRNYLMHASRVGFLTAVDILVKSGVDINEMDDDGFTPLLIAYRYKHELIVQYLLKNGAKTWVEKPYDPQKKYFINDLNKRWD